jgi:hypothetical protein
MHEQYQIRTGLPASLVYGLRTYLARQLTQLFQRPIFVCMGPALMPGSSAACQAASKQPSVLHFLTEQDEMRFREGSKRNHCQVIFGMYPCNGVHWQKRFTSGSKLHAKERFDFTVLSNCWIFWSGADSTSRDGTYSMTNKTSKKREIYRRRTKIMEYHIFLT